MSFERPLVVNPASRVLSCRFSVDVPGPLEAVELFHLALYRPAGRQAVRQLRVEPAVAWLLRHADTDPRPLDQRVRDAAEQGLMALDATSLTRLGEALATCVADGLVLGSRSPAG